MIHLTKLSRLCRVSKLVLPFLLLPLVACAAPGPGLRVLGDEVEDDIIQTYAAYPSGDLTVTGWLFAEPGARDRPLLIFNHGGVGGVSGGTRQLCRWFAGNGFTVFAPSYRGEDDSEGEIEVAVGEVDDVLAAIEALKGDPRVDGDRVLLAGTSHGALVSLKAACRRGLCGRLRGVVAAYGVTDIYKWYQYLLDNDFDVSDPLSRRIYGQGPEDRPEAFAERHLPNFLPTLCPAPIFVVQGAEDRVVPAEQAGFLSARLRELDRNQDVIRVWRTGGHGFLFWDDPDLHSGEELAEAAEARSEVLEFLRDTAGIEGP